MNRPSDTPATKAALASTSACHASAAITVAESIPLSAGRPVAGSIRWCRRRSGGPHTRRARVLVATAPLLRPMSSVASGRSGCSMATVQAIPSGGSRSTRRSPPTLAHAPAAPASSRSRTRRSAANPLPIPPGSNPTPAGRVTVDASRSTVTPSYPNRRADSWPVSPSPSNSKLRS